MLFFLPIMLFSNDQKNPNKVYLYIASSQYIAHYIQIEPNIMLTETNMIHNGSQ